MQFGEQDVPQVAVVYSSWKGGRGAFRYADREFEVADHADLWAAMKTLPAEMDVLRPYLLDGTFQSLSVGTGTVTQSMYSIPGNVGTRPNGPGQASRRPA